MLNLLILSCSWEDSLEILDICAISWSAAVVSLSVVNLVGRFDLGD